MKWPAISQARNLDAPKSGRRVTALKFFDSGGSALVPWGAPPPTLGFPFPVPRRAPPESPLQCVLGLARWSASSTHEHGRADLRSASSVHSEPRSRAQHGPTLGQMGCGGVQSPKIRAFQASSRAGLWLKHLHRIKRNWNRNQRGYIRNQRRWNRRKRVWIQTTRRWIR
jgi:hypothetical protein